MSLNYERGLLDGRGIKKINIANERLNEGNESNLEGFVL